MKNILLKLSIILIMLAIICPGKLSAQFEQKITLQASAGMTFAQGPESLLDIFHNLGYSIDAGIQYNFSRRTAIVAMAKYSTFFDMPDPHAILDVLQFNLLGINLCPKFRFLPHSRFNPYIYAGASVNYISITHGFAGKESVSSVSPLCFGFIAGAGSDLRLNDNIALFAQGGFNSVDQGKVYIDSFFFQMGVNLNMFKARTL